MAVRKSACGVLWCERVSERACERVCVYAYGDLQSAIVGHVPGVRRLVRALFWRG